MVNGIVSMVMMNHPVLNLESVDCAKICLNVRTLKFVYMLSLLVLISNGISLIANVTKVIHVSFRKSPTETSSATPYLMIICMLNLHI